MEEIEEETKAFENLKEVLEIKVEKKNSNETNARLFVAANIEKGAVFLRLKKVVNNTGSLAVGLFLLASCA